MTPKLPKHLAETYALKDWPGQSPRQFFGPKWRLVDLNTLTPAQADSLIRKGFPYLERLPEKKKSSPPKDAPEDKK